MNIEESCDRLAEKYARLYWNEIDRKPFDQKLLDWFTERVGRTGTICDLGCGSGQIARYLYSRGATVCGIDLSIEMVRQAQLLNPGIEFKQGNMLFLSNVPDDSYSGVVSFYSIVHVSREQLREVVEEMFRVLSTDGVLLLTYYVGQEVIHLDELWEEKISVDFYFFETDEVKQILLKTGFEIEEVIEREPYINIEPQRRHAYIFARKLNQSKSDGRTVVGSSLPL